MSAGKVTSVLRFDWSEVSKIRPLPHPSSLAGRLAVRHQEDLVVGLTGSLANVTLQVTARERTSRLPVSSHFFFPV